MSRKHPSSVPFPDAPFFVGLYNGLRYSIILWAIIALAIFHKEISTWLRTLLS